MIHSHLSRLVTALLTMAAVLFSGLTLTTPAAGAAGLATAPTQLTVGQLPEPADVGDLQAPLLGWQVSTALQSAYEVQVATTASGIASPDVWGSGKVASSHSTNVAYAGPALLPTEAYYWRVRTWDGFDVASDWSEVKRFGTEAGATWGESKPVWLGSSVASTWSDYTLEGNFQIVAQNATITFRAQDASNYFMWQFRGNGVNTLAPHVRVGSTFTQLKSVPLGVNLVNNTTYRFKIVATGSTIKTYLNDVLVDTTVDTTYSAGKIGFRTGGSERNSWDDLKVTASTGQVLYNNAFSAPSTDFSCGTVGNGRLSISTGQNCVYGLLGTDWAFLRGEVELAHKPVAWATVFATGSSTAPGRQFVYKLWLNGTFVGLGPTQPIAGETRYDGFDVTELVRSGEANALGAIAWTSTDRRFQAHLVVEFADGTRQTFGTDSSWKSFNGTQVYPDAGSIGTSYFTAPKENLQSAVYPTGFDQPGFDDSTWSPVQVKTTFTNLQPTPTAKVEHQLKLPELVVEKSPGNYFIDYGRTWIGGLSLDIVGTEGQVLDVRFGEALSSAQTVRFAMATGNTYQDKWTLRAGPQHLETWGMRVFRYAEVLGAPTGLTAEDFPALAQVYPYDPSGATFESSDPNLNKVWELSRHTIEATNHNLYVDSWTRERDAYEADSYLQMMANFFVSNDPTLGNYSLEYLLTGRTWPTEWPMYTILAFHDSYQQTGDIEALARNYDQLKPKLPDEWLEASTGLIRKNTGSNGANSCTDCDIVDWPAGERDGFVFRPYNTVINAISYRSYRDMAAIATALGKGADAADFTAKADRLRDAMNDRLWDSAKGAYRDGLNADGTPIAHWAIQASVFATAFGVADADQAAQAAEYIRTRGMACSVYCAAFVLESLYNGDRADVAYTMLTGTGLRSWMNMINKGAGATMEAWDLSLKSNTTYSHPWAASPAYNVPQGMFGIRPTTPGYSTFDVRPQPESVDWAHVTLPTLVGSIGAAYDAVDGRTDVGVYIPGNTVARVSVPGATESDSIVYVDGVATAATYERGYLRVDDVPAGCHVLSLVAGPTASENNRLTRVCPPGTEPDLTAPIVSVVVDPESPSGPNGWYVGEVAVTASATDARSGVATLEYMRIGGEWATYVGPISAPEGDSTYLFRATDRAGNVSVSTSVNVKRDVSAPTVSSYVQPDAPDGESGWYVGAPGLVLQAADEGSGIATIEYRTSSDQDWTVYTEAIAIPEGTTTYAYRATDFVGRTSASASVTVKRDGTAPDLSWNGSIADLSSFVFENVPPAPTCVARDSTSGPASCEITGYSTAVGTHTLTATAYDLAGNSLAVSRTYTVRPWDVSGFYAPVDMGGVVNTVKGGSTVPLKFEVFASGTELTSLATVTGISATKIACDTSAPLDEIEVTASGSTALKYDTTAGTFVYNWKTPTGSGSCYQVKVSTTDGSTVAALFRTR